MKLVNNSHIARVANYDISIKIINIVRHRVRTTLKYSISKNVGGRGVFYTKKKTSFFCINEVVDVLTDLTNNQNTFRQNFDYSKYLEVMKEVQQDRIEYGDMVPDTADEYATLYQAKETKIPKCRTPRAEVVRKKKAERSEFVNRFNSAKINWR